ncbi:MAG TPA: Wzz/FepE/Etk N-terminal domain-containing protein, partial [Leptolyngbya sp.]|nr:Wzz/FepE/Etk N-terminal domain-containing protein [Leptolyngbya sp.]
MSTNPLSKLYQSDLSESGNSLHFLSLKNTETRSEVDFKRIWDVVKRRKLFVGTIALILLGATMAWSVTRKPVYMSTFRLLIEPTKPNPAQQINIPPNELNAGINYTTLSQVLKSAQILEPTFKSLQKQHPSLTFEQFLAGLSITRIKDTEIIEVSYLDSDPNQGLTVTEKLADRYLNYGEQLRSRKLQQGIKFVEKQL